MNRRVVAAWLGTAVLAWATACAGPDAGGEGEAAAEGVEATPALAAGTIVRFDPGFDELVPTDAVVEKIADGFVFIEGPVWIAEEERLLFSDIRDNAVLQWTAADGVSDFIRPWFDGDTVGRRTYGSNGLTRDADGRIVIADTGRRRITRIDDDGSLVSLAEQYEGRRLNSPNDVVYASDGSLYFTDPPYGLAGIRESPLMEQAFSGVYRITPDGTLELLTGEQTLPNGIALSPDESTLYVANSDGERAVWMAYDVGPDGLSNARVFYDVTDVDEGGVPDGMKVDRAGNLWATGPGGVWVFSPDGTHLGTIQPEELPANVGWGDDGSSLYITARTGLYRVRTTSAGRIP